MKKSKRERVKTKSGKTKDGKGKKKRMERNPLGSFVRINLSDGVYGSETLNRREKAHQVTHKN